MLFLNSGWFIDQYGGGGNQYPMLIFYGWFGGPPPIRQAEAHAGFDSAQVFAAEVGWIWMAWWRIGTVFVTLCYPLLPKDIKDAHVKREVDWTFLKRTRMANLVNIMGRSQTDGHKQQYPARANNTRFTSNHTELLISWNKWLVKNTFTSLW